MSTINTKNDNSNTIKSIKKKHDIYLNQVTDAMKVLNSIRLNEQHYNVLLENELYEYELLQEKIEGCGQCC